MFSTNTLHKTNLITLITLNHEILLIYLLSFNFFFFKVPFYLTYIVMLKELKPSIFLI